jgi:hypothetical protein
MSDFVVLQLRPDHGVKGFQGLTELPIKKEKIDFFYPIGDNEGGCIVSLSIGNGVELPVKDSYESLLWITQATTIERSLEFALNRFENNGQIIEDHSLKAMFHDKVRKELGKASLEDIAGIINKAIAEHQADWTPITITAVQENFSNISDYARDVETWSNTDPIMGIDLPTQQAQALKAKLRTAMGLETSKEQRPSSLRVQQANVF